MNCTTPTYHYYIQDHQGNNRVVFNQSGTIEQTNHYYPFGMTFGEGIDNSDNRYKYNNKELDRMHGLDLYDYGARMQNGMQFTTIDPLAEKYYSVSPYAYCKNNPIRFIDPNGMDLWSVNEKGEIVSHEEDESLDKITIVDREGKVKIDKNGNDISISFKYGTINTLKLRYRTSIKGKEKTIEFFKIKGDENGKKIFEFLADPKKTTKVEWSYAKVGKNEGENGMNMIGTTNEDGDTGAGAVLNAYNYTIRELDHNHPNGSFALPKGDLANRDSYLQNNPNIKLNIYSNGQYRPYTTL